MKTKDLKIIATGSIWAWNNLFIKTFFIIFVYILFISLYYTFFIIF